MRIAVTDWKNNVTQCRVNKPNILLAHRPFVFQTRHPFRNLSVRLSAPLGARNAVLQNTSTEVTGRQTRRQRPHRMRVNMARDGCPQMCAFAKFRRRAFNFLRELSRNRLRNSSGLL